ncbi:MAG: Holliday junction branch migration protein RuvA [Candidatus Pacebacteria bacterium]|nr:Holliday junction branch migration protein RuvA [Candidatus Paceibacterota bacterium]
MIGKLRGEFIGLTPDGAALIEVGGVGYAVHVSASTVGELQRAQKDASLLIHTSVREDALDLYGFVTEEELVFFKQLLGVSGIGPKSALGVMNVADATSLRRSIAQGDTSALTRVYGIGKKSAERIVVELRDKLAKEAGTGGESSGDAEVVDALMALGYRADEVRKTLKDMLAKDGASVTERIAAALKYLGSRSG